MKYLKFIFICMLLEYSLVAFSQNKISSEIGRPNTPITLSSPQSQIFEQYINHQISEYNGLPEISVPLYTIEVKGMKIPITLNYHASGIKYKQFDGDIGAGWSVNVGGYRISRNIYGRPDDLSEMYDQQVFHNYLDGLGRLDGYSRDSLLASICLTPEETINTEPDVLKNLQDGEYDHFMYMLPTTSGKFLLTNRSDLSTTVLSDNPDIIKLNDGNTDKLITNATITDGNGIKYSLGTFYTHREEMYCPMVRNSVNTGWLLSRIKTPNNDSINFNYTSHYVNIERDLKMVYTIQDAPFHSAYNYPNYMNPNLITKYNGGFSDQQDPFKSDASLSYISSIEANRIKISFKRENVFSATSSHVLTEINIEDKKTGECLKKIRFKYSKFPYAASSNVTPWHRLLDSVEFSGGDGKKGGQYSFLYNLPTQSLEGAYPDQWGYYKFGYYPSAASSVFKGLFLHDEFASDLVLSQATKASGRKAEFKSLEFYVPFLNRSNNIDAPTAFTLRCINSPLGGSTYYTYESNQYKFGHIGGGLRIKKIETSSPTAEHPIITEFAYGDDGYGSLSGSHSDFKQCFADEYFYFSSELSLPYGEKDIYSLGTRQAIKIYSTHPLNKEMNMMSKVHYDKVTRKQYDSATKAYLGQTVSTYAPKREYEPGYTPNPNVRPSDGIFSYFNYLGYGKMHILQYNWWTSPELMTRMTYNQDSILVRKEKWEYKTLKNTTWEGLHVKQKVFFEKYPGAVANTKLCEHYRSVIQIYDSQFYNISYELRKPTQYNVWNYDLKGKCPVFTSTLNTYDDLGRLTAVTNNNSLNGNKTEKYFYPENSSTLQQRNMVQTITQKSFFNNGKETERFVFEYPENSIYLKKIKHSFGTESNTRTEYICDSYDTQGNVLQSTHLDGTIVSYIWGYNMLYPIAEIINASLEDIYIFLDKKRINDISHKIEPSASDWDIINSLRDKLKNAQVNTYKYKPLVGLIEKTDPSGLISCYDYDSLGQLIEQSFKDEGVKKIIESYTYTLAKSY